MKLIANNSLETQLKIKEVEDKKKSIMDKVAELNLTVEETVEVQRFKIDMDNSEYAKISHLNPSFYKQFSSGMNKLTPAQRELFNLWMDSHKRWRILCRIKRAPPCASRNTPWLKKSLICNISGKLPSGNPTANQAAKKVCAMPHTTSAIWRKQWMLTILLCILSTWPG